MDRQSLHRTFSSSIWNSERGGILKKSYVKHTFDTYCVIKYIIRCALRIVYVTLKKKLLAIGNVILFSKYGRDGGRWVGYGIPNIILYESISCFCYLFNNMQPLLHLKRTRMKCSLKYFALNCNFFISLVWKLVCLMSF